MFGLFKRVGWSRGQSAPPADSKPGCTAAEEEAAAWHVRAEDAAAAGELQTALGMAGHAVRLAPGNVAYRRQLAGVLRRLEAYQDASRVLREALPMADEESPEVLLEIGEIHLDAGDTSAVVASVDELMAHEWVFESSLLAGLLAFRQKDWEAARSAFQNAEKQRPDDFRALNGLGVVSLSLGEPTVARHYLEQAIAVDPAAWQPYTNLALLTEQAGDLVHAAELFEEAFQRNPMEMRARFNAALLYLKIGDFRRGWEAYESRFLVPEIRHFFPQREDARLWEGDDPAGKDILVLAEQGYGDQIQFCRYLPLLAERGARVHYACQRELARLFSCLAGGVVIHPSRTEIPDHDLQCALMSLPRLMGTDTLEKIPATVPYLSAPIEEVARWAERLKRHGGVRVGLVWASNNQDDPFRDRRLRLSDLGPFWEVPGCTFFSLQIGRVADEILPSCVVDLAGDLLDFADTAAAMGGLDLVISVDTAAAHLAGALGMPVWLLVREEAEWRWLRDRDDSPWYPSMRIFRRNKLQSWPDLVEIVSVALTNRVREGGNKAS